MKFDKTCKRNDIGNGGNRNILKIAFSNRVQRTRSALRATENEMLNGRVEFDTFICRRAPATALQESKKGNLRPWLFALFYEVDGSIEWKFH